MIRSNGSTPKDPVEFAQRREQASPENKKKVVLCRLEQDDQTATTKPPAGSCSRILDQSLGSTRARSSRNRPLESPSTMAGLVLEGGLDDPRHSRQSQGTLRRTPEAVVDVRCSITRLLSRTGYCVIAWSLNDSRKPVVHQPTEQGPGRSAVSARSSRPSLEAGISCRTRMARHLDS